MTDRWNEELVCPKCWNVGVASLSQVGDTPTATVDGVPDGFKTVQTEYGPNFHCGVCDIPVVL
jgi:hypothetical protein